MVERLALLLRITRSHGIVRRYFVVNGFDGALTMLGILSGFYMSGKVDYTVVVNTCFGAAVALGMSGLTSAYISEAAEQRKKLLELEQAMVTSLEDSAHGDAARYLPVAIAIVNSLSPLCISLVIIAPIWAAHRFPVLGFDPLQGALAMTLVIVFLLGVLLGRISDVHWLWSGIRTLLIALFTGAVIFLLAS
ncbi:MAG: hypothetical protein Kow0089_08700 [Desulfobulbaceae bacterium]